MRIEEIRIYAEVLEQGLDFKNYVRRSGYTGKIKKYLHQKNTWRIF